MFGRGQRDDLDDEDGEKLASELRDRVREELKQMREEDKSTKKLEKL